MFEYIHDGFYQDNCILQKRTYNKLWNSLYSIFIIDKEINNLHESSKKIKDFKFKSYNYTDKSEIYNFLGKEIKINNDERKEIEGKLFKIFYSIETLLLFLHDNKIMFTSFMGKKGIDEIIEASEKYFPKD